MNLLEAISIEGLAALQVAFRDGLAKDAFVEVMLRALAGPRLGTARWSRDTLSSLFYEIDFEGKGSIGWPAFTNFVISCSEPSVVSMSGTVDEGPTISSERIGLRLRSDAPLFADQCSQFTRLIYVPDACKMVAATANRVTIHDGSNTANTIIGKAKVTGSLLDAAYHPATSSLITSSTKGVVEVFDATRDLMLHRTLVTTCPVAKLSPLVGGANILFAGDTGGCIMALDASKFSPLAAIEVAAAAGTTSGAAMALTPISNSKSVGGPSTPISRVNTSGRPIAPLTGVRSCPIRAVSKYTLSHHTDAISALLYVHSHRFALLSTLLTAGMDNTIAVCDVESQQLIHLLPSAHSMYVRGLDVNPHRSLVVTYGNESIAGIVALDTPHHHQRPVILADAAVPHGSRLVGAICVDKDEVITADIGGMLKLWDLRMQRCVQTCIIPQVIDITYQSSGSTSSSMARIVPKRLLAGGISYNPTTQQLLTLGPSVSAFDRVQQQVEASTHEDPVVAMAWNPFTFTLLTATPHDIALWDVRTGVCVVKHKDVVASSSRSGAISCMSVDHLQSGRRILVGTTTGFVVSLIPATGAVMWACPCVDGHLLDRRLCGIAFCEAGEDHNVLVGLGAGCIKAFREHFLAEPCRLLYVPTVLEPVFGVMGETDAIPSKAELGEETYRKCKVSTNSAPDELCADRTTADKRRALHDRYPEAAALLQPDLLGSFAVSHVCGLIISYASIDSTLLVMSTVTRRCHAIPSEPRRPKNRGSTISFDDKSLKATTAASPEILSICFLVEHSWDVLEGDEEEPCSFLGALSIFATGDVLGCLNVYSVRAHDPHNETTTAWLITIHTAGNIPCHSLASSQDKFLIAGAEKGMVMVWDATPLITATLLFDLDGESGEYSPNAIPQLAHSMSAFGESPLHRRLNKRMSRKQSQRTAVKSKSSMSLLPSPAVSSPLSTGGVPTDFPQRFYANTSMLSSSTPSHPSPSRGEDSFKGMNSDNGEDEMFAFPTSQRRLELERLEEGMARVRNCIAKGGNILSQQGADRKGHQSRTSIDMKWASSIESDNISAMPSAKAPGTPQGTAPIVLGDVLMKAREKLTTIVIPDHTSIPTSKNVSSSAHPAEGKLPYNAAELSTALSDIANPKPIRISRGSFTLPDLGTDGAAPLTHCISFGDIGVVALCTSGFSPSVCLVTADGRQVGPLCANRQADELTAQSQSAQTPLVVSSRHASYKSITSGLTQYRFSSVTKPSAGQRGPRVDDNSIHRLRRQMAREGDTKQDGTVNPIANSQDSNLALADVTVPPIVRELAGKEAIVKDRREALASQHRRRKMRQKRRKELLKLTLGSMTGQSHAMAESVATFDVLSSATDESSEEDMPAKDDDSRRQKSQPPAPQLQISARRRMTTKFGASGFLPFGSLANSTEPRRSVMESSGVMSRRAGMSKRLSADPSLDGGIKNIKMANAPAHHSLFFQYAQRRDGNATPDEDEDELLDNDDGTAQRRRQIKPKFPNQHLSHTGQIKPIHSPVVHHLTSMIARPSLPKTSVVAPVQTARLPSPTSPHLLQVRRKHASPRVQVIGAEESKEPPSPVYTEPQTPILPILIPSPPKANRTDDLFARLAVRTPPKRRYTSKIPENAPTFEEAELSPRRPTEVSIRSRR